MHTSQSSKRFLALDGLRGIAAIVVVQRHCSHWFYDFHLDGGYLAVDFFFLLSGFVLGLAYDQKLHGGLDWKTFMLQRLERLYPLYLIGMLLGALALALRHELFAIDLILAVAFLPRITLANARWLIGPAWSLALELLANFGFAVWHRHLRTSILTTLILVSALALAYSAFHFGSLDIGYEASTFSGGVARVLFSFFSGVLLWRNREKFPRVRSGAWTSATLLIALLAISVPKDFRPIADTLIVMGGMPFVLLLAAGSQPQQLSISIFQLLGEMSYAVYVLHWSVILFVDHYWKAARGADTHPTVLAGVCIILVTAIISIPMQRYYDATVRKFLRQVLERTA